MEIVEASAVTEHIEVALEKLEKSVTELIFILLAHLYSCADGRERFLQHAGGIALLLAVKMTTSSPQPQRLLEADDNLELPAMIDERRRRGGRNEDFTCWIGAFQFHKLWSKSTANVESRGESAIL
ncbi:hypothetical protein SESBI_32947 [Sesbania bispinosa]|nr:hypothetical protein SESBI_32947 [Sesbania bispinosa]